jgi:hypothetical protein
MIGGLEMERTAGMWNNRFGVDYYTMHYPNYQSLVSQSQFETSLDTTTYSELSQQAGTDVLDYTAVATFLEVSHKFSPKVVGLAHYDFSMKSFNDQNTVSRTGEFTATKRSDMIHYLTLGLTVATPRVSLGLSNTVQMYDSNQNSWDAANGEFTPNYYDFLEEGFAPSISFYLGKLEMPSRLSFFWELSYRLYNERLAQYADGTPKTDKVYQVANTMGASFTYPLAKSLSIKCAANYRDASSNMRYEKNYKYNYYTVNYFCGLNWEL